MCRETANNKMDKLYNSFVFVSGITNYPLLDIQFVGKQPEKGQTKKYGEAWREKATN